MDILEVFNIMDILRIFIVLILILTTATEIGFLMQKFYVDIRAIALSAIISVLVCIIISPKGIILGIITAYILFSILLNKFSEVELMPDTIFASIIGFGVATFIIMKYPSILMI